ncbi:hypothetical protein DAPPUDRAFT_114831 [Daphnia pulex]|uniref:Uncharacterized protein n=1 Tax=Daphnia pulex TaxID=6669 RepID=E9HJD5_DAPPU|nr:hypothetical protein DAPPUDRAFT_114831 [Daphnia pulex]|eukprot:EFX68163.1 hypothetical protein DAPPUDRAFT_114831 [Daphnia pulex]
MNLTSPIVITLRSFATYTRYALTVSLHLTNKPSTALGSSLRRSTSGTCTNALVPKARRCDTLGFFPLKAASMKPDVATKSPNGKEGSRKNCLDKLHQQSRCRKIHDLWGLNMNVNLLAGGNFVNAWNSFIFIMPAFSEVLTSVGMTLAFFMVATLFQIAISFCSLKWMMDRDEAIKIVMEEIAPDDAAEPMPTPPPSPPRAEPMTLQPPAAAAATTANPLHHRLSRLFPRRPVIPPSSVARPPSRPPISSAPPMCSGFHGSGPRLYLHATATVLFRLHERQRQPAGWRAFCGLLELPYVHNAGVFRRSHQRWDGDHYLNHDRHAVQDRHFLLVLGS